MAHPAARRRFVIAGLALAAAALASGAGMLGREPGGLGAADLGAVAVEAALLAVVAFGVGGAVLGRALHWSVTPVPALLGAVLGAVLTAALWTPLALAVGALLDGEAGRLLATRPGAWLVAAAAGPLLLWWHAAVVAPPTVAAGLGAWMVWRATAQPAA